MVFLYKSNPFSGALRSSEESRVFWINRNELPDFILADGFDWMLRIFENDSLSENYYWFDSGKRSMENK